MFNDLDPKIGLALGVIDIKDNEVEAPDLVASRIETIVKTVGYERVRYVNPDCGFFPPPPFTRIAVDYRRERTFP